MLPRAKVRETCLQTALAPSRIDSPLTNVCCRCLHHDQTNMPEVHRLPKTELDFDDHFPSNHENEKRNVQMMEQ